MSTHYSASHSFTLRARLDDRPGSFADLARAIADAGGLLDAIDLVRVDPGTKIRDISVFATDGDHADRIVAACADVAGVEVERVSDRTFLLHLGGKIHMSSNSPVKTRDDLSMAYTPGVARVCRAIADDPESAWNLTIKRNTVAVVTDGSAVLGLGDIGPEAAMPVMEGKALLFKEFGGIDAWPLCLATKDTDEIVATVRRSPRLRRDQPRGHRCAALLRGRGPAAGVARHPGVPRRPARHGDRRARRVPERAAGRRQADPGRQGRRDRRRSRGDRRDPDLQAAGVRNVIGCDSGGPSIAAERA